MRSANRLPQRRTLLALAAGLVAWVSLLLVVFATWDDFVRATGDTLDECDRGTCGALGEFTDDRPGTLFVLFLVGTGIPAGAIAWFVRRLIRRIPGTGDA